MHSVSNVELALSALLLEAVIGYPDFVYRAIGHPVTWAGALLAWLDMRLNQPGCYRRGRGVLALLVLVAASGGGGWMLERFCGLHPAGAVLLILAGSTLPAQRSLDRHVRAVAVALDGGGLEAGRRAVSMIVGRNPEHLDAAGVARAAIESLAENFSDGVVAPAFWLAIGGLPGGACYKAVNTADSMIGHRTPRYAEFGWAAARLDDLVNLPASRLSALFLVLAAAAVGASPLGAMRAVWRDARHHGSPNAGWPEAAMAGALGLSLAGPRVYGEALVEDAFMGDGRRDATAADIRRALRLYRVACVVPWLALAVIALA
jgi:adenosylcobinamide-phosphate synthase